MGKKWDCAGLIQSAYEGFIDVEWDSCEEISEAVGMLKGPTIAFLLASLLKENTSIVKSKDPFLILIWAKLYLFQMQIHQPELLKVNDFDKLIKWNKIQGIEDWLQLKDAKTFKKYVQNLKQWEVIVILWFREDKQGEEIDEAKKKKDKK